METNNREFEEVVEEVAEEEVQTNDNQKVNDGIVIYQTETGGLGYQYIGEPTIKDMTYYHRLLTELVDNLWETELTVKDTDGDVDA